MTAKILRFTRRAHRRAVTQNPQSPSAGDVIARLRSLAVTRPHHYAVATQLVATMLDELDRRNGAAQ